MASSSSPSLDMDALLDGALDEFDRQEESNKSSSLPPSSPSTLPSSLSATSSTLSPSSPSPSPPLPAPSLSSLLTSSPDTAELLSLLGPDKMSQLNQYISEIAMSEMKKQEGNVGENGKVIEEEPSEEALMKLMGALEKVMQTEGSGSGGEVNNNPNYTAALQALMASTSPTTSPSISSATLPIGSSSSTPSSPSTSPSTATATVPTNSTASSPPSSSSPYSSSIKDAISGLNSSSASSSSSPSDDLGGVNDILNKLMAEFESKLGEELNNHNPNNPSSASPSTLPSPSSTSSPTDGIDSMLDNLMGQMMSREYLYDPMKEIDNKFPKWLSTHRESLTPVELKQYEKQAEIFHSIVLSFENSPNDKKRVVDLMNELQQHGNPPKEIVGNLLPPGFDFDPSNPSQSLPEGMMGGESMPSEEELLKMMKGAGGGPGDCPIQ